MQTYMKHNMKLFEEKNGNIQAMPFHEPSSSEESDMDNISVVVSSDDEEQKSDDDF